MFRHNTSKLTLHEVYRNLYPWKTINEFVQQLKSTIAYKSDDNSLIALCKPFGVGIYSAKDPNTSKQNQDRILSNLAGSPRYCIQDALKAISDELSPNKPYQVVKSLDRYASGLILLSNDTKNHKPMIDKSAKTSMISRSPPWGFRAITSGYPILKGNKISEKVGLEMIEVDELGDYKEPIIVLNPSGSFERKKPNRYTYQVELTLKKVNKESSASLVEVFVSKTRYDFTRCYISSKTSFILGDVHFSKRIREILGKPMQVSAFKSSHRYDDSYEPLNSNLRNLLGVSKNSSVPLMLDHHAIRLKGFDRKQKSKDLFIQSPYMPLHFALTAERLNLLDDDDVVDGDLSRSNSNINSNRCNSNILFVDTVT